MLTLKTGGGKKERRVRHALYFAALAVVFIFGLFSIVGSFSTLSQPNPQLDQKLAERQMLKNKYQNAMINLDKAKGKQEEAAAWKEINDIESQMSRVDKEIETMTGRAESCFTSEMKVITAEGPRPIKDLKVGDRVLTMDEGGRQGYNPVLKTYKDKNNHYYLINGKIKVTALHRFATADGWKKARELKVGDRIRTTEGTLEAVVSTELVAADLKVYNLTVAENHNFFVAPDGATGYLVHNTGGGGGK